MIETLLFMLLALVIESRVKIGQLFSKVEELENFKNEQKTVNREIIKDLKEVTNGH